MTDLPKPKLRWYQFGIRSLLLFVTLCAILCSCFASRMQKANRQRRAIESIRNGQAYYYHQWKWDGPVIPLAMKPSEEAGYRWARDILGDDFFFDVDSVEFDRATDKDLEVVKGFPSLRVLVISDSPEITDDGLAHVSGLVNLRRLDLDLFCNYNLDITDAGLRHLEGLTELQTLNLTGTNISGNGLAYLKGMVQLEVLRLSNTGVDDDALGHLTGLPKLKELRLGGTKITNAGLAQLEDMKGLRCVDLARTAITDAGLKHLKKLTQLRSLFLEDSKITEAGMDILRESLPNCKF